MTWNASQTTLPVTGTSGTLNVAWTNPNATTVNSNVYKVLPQTSRTLTIKFTTLKIGNGQKMCIRDSAYSLVELKISRDHYFMPCEISKITLKNSNLIKKGTINIAVDGSIHSSETGNYDLTTVTDASPHTLSVGESYVCRVLMIQMCIRDRRRAEQ